MPECELIGCNERFKEDGTKKYHSRKHGYIAKLLRQNIERKSKKCFSCGEKCYGYSCRKCSKNRKGMRLTTRRRTKERKIELKLVEQWNQKLK